MNNINSSSYVSLFNSDTQINNATANTVIICNNDGIITSARNIDADIDTQTININKLNASGPLDAAHFLTGAGT